MDILNEFFSYLGYRLNKENDLSDITWALLRASDKFRKLFLEFFFSDMGDRKIKNSIIERERRDDKDNSSRVDLHIFIKNNPLYIIEVKINDKNHHFEQYKKEYEVLPDHFGYITNYELKKDGGYQVRQWETLYDYLLEHINDEDKLIKGYCEYIKQVCGFVKFKGPMRLNSIYNSLFEFIKVLEKLVNREEDDFKLKEKGVSSMNGKNCYSLGVDFQVITQSFKTTVWIGIYYDKKNPDICLGIRKGEKSLCNDLKKQSCKSNDNDLFEIDGYDSSDGVYWFHLKKEKREELENCESLEEQEGILKNYIDKVVHYLLMVKTNKVDASEE